MQVDPFGYPKMVAILAIKSLNEIININCVNLRSFINVLYEYNKINTTDNGKRNVIHPNVIVNIFDLSS